jgi:hypothetical protein
MTAFVRPGMAAPVRVVRRVVDSFVRRAVVVAGRVPVVVGGCLGWLR